MSTSTITIQTPAGQASRRAGPARALLRDCRGALLLETVIASMVFALVGVAVLAGLSTVYTSGSKTQVQSVAENLARNQMEHIFSGPYREPDQTPYPTISSIGGTPIPEGYSVSVAPPELTNPGALFPDPEIEIITVAAGHEGNYFLELQTLRGRTDGLQLRYSLNEDLTNSARLHGGPIETCSEPQEEGPCLNWTIYVFLDDPEGRAEGPVDLYLNGGLLDSISYSPWVYQWDTEEVVNDVHNMKAEVPLTELGGEKVNVTSKFEISN